MTISIIPGPRSKLWRLCAPISVLATSLVACGSADEVGSAGRLPDGGGGSSSGSGGSSPGGASGASGASGSGGSGGASGSSGSAGTAGKAGAGGAGGSAGGVAGSAGSGGKGGTTSVTPPTWADCKPWPQATSSVNLDSTETVSGTFDGQLRRYVFRGDDSDPIFELGNNATLRNVIIAAPGADGVHCRGNCTLANVWWEDVGEDAATFEGTSSSTRVTIDCSGARKADDKILQHNGGGTVTVTRFFAEDFGKVYRSCGNCDSQYPRQSVFDNIIARTPGDAIAGLNANYMDTAKLTNIFLYDPTRTIHVCERYTGNTSGAEPPFLGFGPDAEHCLYMNTAVSYTQ